jgi:capsular exopolysaccharide synthesis family protein
MRLAAPVRDYLTTWTDYLTTWTNYLPTIPDNIAKLWRSDESQARDAETEKITYIQDHLRVEAKDNSSVISVQFEAGAPDTAAAVVNAIMTTYTSTIGAARDAEIAKADQWISQQMAINWKEVESAEQRVTQFTQQNKNITEVQGALTATIQLSKDQGQLAIAREELARLQASLDTASQSGGAGTEETLNSKSVQALKELEAKTLELTYALSPSDPRRAPLKERVDGLRAQINRESKLVVSSISRSVQIARARVQALETAVQSELELAQASTVAVTTLRQLTSDLEAKRQLYVAFLTGAGQARLAAVQAPTARILFQAVPPRRPTHSFGVLSILFGFFAGALGAAGIIIMRSTLSMKINSTDEMAVATGLPMFGALPDFGQIRRGNVLARRTGPVVTETFRGMWLAMRSLEKDGRAILVTSSEIDEGKTTVATELARRFASDGSRVLLIDADLRRPQLANILGLRPEHYLESVLSGDVTLNDATVYDTKSGLSCLFSNGSSTNPIRSLSSDQFKQLITTARRTYDFVILDSAPALHVADPVLLASICQQVIFVVEAGRVSSALVGEAVRRFSEEDRTKIFTLLTRVRSNYLDKRDYYGGYAS